VVTNEKELPFSQKTYDRYCRQIDKEDNLIDQRLNWMIVSQSLLFGALGVSNQHIAGLMYLIIPLVGIGVSILVGTSVWAAVSSLQHYRVCLEEACPREDDKNMCLPELHREAKNLSLGLVSPKALPWLFLVAWIVILIWAIANSLVCLRLTSPVGG
jgi:hypothetical protein